MRKELEEKLARWWPTWFDLAGTPMMRATARGFECGDGWFEVLQVKEKLGTLRVYASHQTDAIYWRIEAAALEASRTCEACGKPRRQREPGGATPCDEHAQDLR